jgi:hypothetical protein
VEGAHAGDELVRHHPEGEDVGARIDLPAFDLLRGKVPGGAEGDSGLGELADRVLRLGDAEVEDLDGAVLEYPDVGRLDVAVDDPPAMCEVEGLADREEDRDDGPRSLKVPAAASGEVEAGEKLLTMYGTRPRRLVEHQ